uniref:ATP synthase peripheral stalk subunit OSCP, mitochondrial n=1 Tax=Enchytraeus cf. crypticus SL-2017 TaxID=2052677 RepID=A0A286Q4Z7_9ANNE|nr:mitochondrial ATP synthase subunit OSCP-like precursor [Enchytraeus cf. crypticus SL-2017]
MASRRVGLTVMRGFSTSVAAQGKLVAPPVHVFGIEGRYAHALYSAATKEKKLEVVEKDIKDIQVLLKSDKKLSEFIVNPVIKRNVKREAVVAAFKKKNYSSVTVNLFGAMADNGRLNKINSVFGTFEKLMSAHRGEVLCTVTTAKPLDQTYLKELRTTLEGFLKKGEVLQLETKVDPSLIGGMVVNIGDKYVDMSTASKIKLYTNVIKQAI